MFISGRGCPGCGYAANAGCMEAVGPSNAARALNKQRALTTARATAVQTQSASGLLWAPPCVPPAGPGACSTHQAAPLPWRSGPPPPPVPAPQLLAAPPAAVHTAPARNTDGTPPSPFAVLFRRLMSSPKVYCGQRLLVDRTRHVLLHVKEGRPAALLRRCIGGRLLAQRSHNWTTWAS